MDIKYEIEVALEQWTAHNHIFRNLIRLISLICFIYTTCFTESHFWLLLNLLHLTTTMFWYSRLLLPMPPLYCFLLSFILVNSLIPNGIQYTVTPSHPLPPTSNGEPPMIAKLSNIHSLTQTQFQYKDFELANSIRNTELLWCRAMAAVCRLADPELLVVGGEKKFLAEWKANATKYVGYKKILKGSKYAHLEDADADADACDDDDGGGGLWCSSKAFCHPRPKHNTLYLSPVRPSWMERWFGLEQRPLQSVWNETDPNLASNFFELAQMLHTLRWEMIHIVTQHNSGLHFTKGVYEERIQWVQEILKQHDHSPTTTTTTSFFLKLSPFANLIVETRKKKKNKSPPRPITTAIPSSSSSSPPIIIDQSLLRRSAITRISRVQEIFSSSSSSQTTPHDSTLLQEIQGNLTFAITWDIWMKAGQKVLEALNAVEELEVEEVEEEKWRWEERFILRDEVWWTVAFEDGRIGRVGVE
ncbi:hypothetical protein AC578_775 [Pseudocercospora eumusae]|uniref:Uncharacterized protein n=1 Tax=Pseudocercospora eumusae TaxID=321146 RepID=A0A139HMP9_9PEZI|nr:hypothetical protein AC578_775 [Pseudocercospora eumusae]